MKDETISRAWLKTKFHNTVGGNGIRQELSEMAFDEDGKDSSEYQTALDTAERWRNTLEEMAEVTRGEDQMHVTVLWTICTHALTDLLTHTPYRPAKQTTAATE